jgi:hypothetical protein
MSTDISNSYIIVRGIKGQGQGSRNQRSEVRGRGSGIGGSEAGVRLGKMDEKPIRPAVPRSIEAAFLLLSISLKPKAKRLSNLMPLKAIFVVRV